MGGSGNRVFFTYIFVLLVSTVRSISLLTVPPRDFRKGDLLEIKVNKLSSTKTLLPYDYYHLNYCKPQIITNSKENVVDLLPVRGDHIKNSVYSFHMREEQPCEVACRMMLDAESSRKFIEKIDDQYRVNMFLDNLPVVVLGQRSDGGRSTTHEQGFHVGFKLSSLNSKLEGYYINNHLSFRVLYHKNLETDSARIVGFEVTPKSVNNGYMEWDDKNPQLVRCSRNNKTIFEDIYIHQFIEKDREVVFTYDVSFKESNIKWESRWDTYFLKSIYENQWFFIMKSLVVVIGLSGLIALILFRTLHIDMVTYNNLRIEDVCQEETGWELIHGDVFRLPANAGLLCVYVGTGVQILAMILVTMIFALLGFLSPSNRGWCTTAMVVLWVFMCFFAGYSSARLYKVFKGKHWKRNTLKTAFMFPGILFAILFGLNALIWVEKSSGAVPFGTMFSIGCLWFGTSVPLVFLGSYLGFRKPATENPVKTNRIPAQIPRQPWFLRQTCMIFIGGIIPYASICMELYFIMTSIWLNKFQYGIGELCIIFVIFVITCLGDTVILCYYQLCCEDYNWWWRAYMTAGFPAFYVFLYSIFYFFTKLKFTKLVSIILYFGYMAIASCALFLLLGTLGFHTFFWFVRKIYSAIKKD